MPENQPNQDTKTQDSGAETSSNPRIIRKRAIQIVVILGLVIGLTQIPGLRIDGAATGGNGGGCGGQTSDTAGPVPSEQLNSDDNDAGSVPNTNQAEDASANTSEDSSTSNIQDSGATNPTDADTSNIDTGSTTNTNNGDADTNNTDAGSTNAAEDASSSHTSTAGDASSSSALSPCTTPSSHRSRLDSTVLGVPDFSGTMTGQYNAWTQQDGTLPTVIFTNLPANGLVDFHSDANTCRIKHPFGEAVVQKSYPGFCGNGTLRNEPSDVATQGPCHPQASFCDALNRYGPVGCGNLSISDELNTAIGQLSDCLGWSPYDRWPMGAYDGSVGTQADPVCPLIGDFDISYTADPATGTANLRIWCKITVAGPGGNRTRGGIRRAEYELTLSGPLNCGG